MKTAIIIILSLLIIATAGGSYYYYWVYQPKQYALRVVGVYAKLEAAGLKPDTSTLKDKNDYSGAIKVLDERIDLLTRLQGDLAAIKPPKSFARVHADITDFAALLLKQHKEAQQRGLFFSKVHDLLADSEVFKGEVHVLEKSNITRMGALQKLWKKHLAQDTLMAKELFVMAMPGLTAPSFSELKARYEAALPAADAFSDIILSFNPALDASQAGRAASASMQKKIESAGTMIGEFYKLLNAAVDKESAYDILSFRFSSLPQTEMSERIFKISNTIQNLKKIYPR